MTGRFLGVLTLVPLLALAGSCGDDGGGSGALGASVVDAEQMFANAACGCFSELSTPFDTRGACIDALDVSPAAGDCFAEAVDAIPGVEAELTCERDAKLAFVSCVENNACAGAATCDAALQTTLEDVCPRSSAAASAALDAARTGCGLGTGGGGGPNDPDGVNACPQTLTSAGVGGTITGDTSALGDDYSLLPDGENCPMAGEGAPDDTVRWTAPSAGTFVLAFDAGATSFNAVMYTQDACPMAGGAQVSTVCSRVGGGTTIVFSPTEAGQIATLIVDGLTADDSGTYTINVTAGEGGGGDDDDDFGGP